MDGFRLIKVCEPWGQTLKPLARKRHQGQNRLATKTDRAILSLDLMKPHPILFLMVLTLCLSVLMVRAVIGISAQMVLGNPSGATADTNDPNQFGKSFCRGASPHIRSTGI